MQHAQWTMNFNKIENPLMETAKEIEGDLGDLHRALDDATELLAAFLSCARGNELPPAILIDAADEAIGQVAQWRLIISRTKALLNERHGAMPKSMFH